MKKKQLKSLQLNRVKIIKLNHTHSISGGDNTSTCGTSIDTCTTYDGCGYTLVLPGMEICQSTGNTNNEGSGPVEYDLGNANEETNQFICSATYMY